MNADAFFATGRQHRVCQDYAAASAPGDSQVFAVVSDGCSSSPHTDFGARFLCRRAAALVRNGGFDPTVISGEVLDEVLRAGRILDLPDEALDATLLVASVEDDLRVRVYGDGVVVGRRRDGGGDLHVIEFPSGAPMYPSYWLRPSRLMGYCAEFGIVRTVTTTVSGGVPVTVEVLPVGEDGQPVPVEFRFDPVAYDLVLLCSDGVRSFQRKVSTSTSLSFEPVPVEEVVRELLAVKGFTGEFITRRVRRFLRDIEALGWHHNDDLAVAGVWLEGGPS